MNAFRSFWVQPPRRHLCLLRRHHFHGYQWQAPRFLHSSSLSSAQVPQVVPAGIHHETPTATIIPKTLKQHGTLPPLDAMSILERPVGSMAHFVWRQGQARIAEWCQPLKHQQLNSGNGMENGKQQLTTHCESLEVELQDAMRLFERLLQERQSYQKANERLSEQNPAQIYTWQPHATLLNSILHKWLELWKSLQLHNKDVSHHPTVTHLSERWSPPGMVAWMDHLVKHYPDTTIRPDEHTYNLLLQGANMIPCPDAAFMNTLLQRMIHAYPHLCPRSSHFHLVMAAFIQQPPADDDDNGAFDRAHGILQQLLHLHAHAQPHHQSQLTPTHAMFAMLAGKARHDPHKAEHVLRLAWDHGIPPHRFLYETCVNAWMERSSGGSNSYEAVERADDLIFEMMASVQQGYNTQPTLSTLIQVLRGWTSSHHADAPARAEAICTVIVNTYSSLQNNKRCPDGTTHVVQALVETMRIFALTGHVEKTRHLLQQLDSMVGRKNMAPVYHCKAVTSLVTALNKSKDTQDYLEAEQVFTEYKVGIDNGTYKNCVMDRYLYTAMLHAYGKAGQGEKAEALLQQMMDDYESGNKHAHPIAQSFDYAMLAWSRSGDPQAATRAERLLHRMKALQESASYGKEVQPNVVTYNVLLSALECTHDLETARRGMRYLEELEQAHQAGHAQCRPSTVTYTHAIRLWVNIHDPSSIMEALQLYYKMWDRALAGDRGATPTANTFGALASVLVHCPILPEQKKKVRLMIMEHRQRIRTQFADMDHSEQPTSKESIEQ
jgi:pentatricopeptide repeat protein